MARVLRLAVMLVAVDMVRDEVIAARAAAHPDGPRHKAAAPVTSMGARSDLVVQHDPVKHHFAIAGSSQRMVATVDSPPGDPLAIRLPARHSGTGDRAETSTAADRRIPWAPALSTRLACSGLLHQTGLRVGQPIGAHVLGAGHGRMLLQEASPHG